MDTYDLQTLTRSQMLVDEGMRRRAAEEFGLDLGVAEGRLRLSQRRRQRWGISLVAVSMASVLLVLPAHLPDLGFASEVVRLSSLSFAACLLLLAVYLPLAAVDVEVSRRRIDWVRRWWWVSLRRRSVLAEAVADLSIDPGRSGSIGRSYDLVGRGDFGKLKLVDDIPDREFLATIRRQIMLAAGLRPSGTH
ncbi:MAG: hypothetical protein EP301_14220 [Gammaproteobacteria bacterium]|nr:MAG: hypothetical protein EP301_14220 [Gammaproteobacteria bacterium]